MFQFIKYQIVEVEPITSTSKSSQKLLRRDFEKKLNKLVRRCPWPGTWLFNLTIRMEASYWSAVKITASDWSVLILGPGQEMS